MAADAAKGLLGGFLRASVTRLANSYMTSATAAVSPHTVIEITGKAQIEDVSAK